MSITIKLPYHIGNYTIRCEDENINQIFREYYGVYCCDYDDGTIVINVEPEQWRWRIRVGCEEIYTNDPVQTIHNILYSEKRIQHGLYALHAGAVCRNKKAVIFVAATNAGKTTLITFLTQKGFEYVSDDCVFIDMKSNTVHACQTPIHLRKGGIEVLTRYNCLPEKLVYCDERYIFTPKNLSPSQMALGRICFIERGTVNETVVLPKAEVLNRLLVAPIVAYPLTGEYIRFLSHLIPFCSMLRYRDMDYVMEVFGNTFTNF